MDDEAQETNQQEGGLHHLVRRSEQPASPETRLSMLEDIVQRYPGLEDENPELAKQARKSFLRLLGDLPEAPDNPVLASFLAQSVHAEDFADLSWRSPDQALNYAELLYSFKYTDEAIAERSRSHVLEALKHALHQFEENGELEKMFQLYQRAPVPLSIDDSELRRIHNRAAVYEVRRVRRHRRLLYAYLVLQVFLVLVAFPLLFINAENGAIRQQIEQSTHLSLPPERVQYLNYGDGVYWALITAASIGYGDIKPVTGLGKMLAAILGVMGVITIGVIAGLILQWITPRRLD